MLPSVSFVTWLWWFCLWQLHAFGQKWKGSKPEHIVYLSFGQHDFNLILQRQPLMQMIQLMRTKCSSCCKHTSVIILMTELALNGCPAAWSHNHGGRRSRSLTFWVSPDREETAARRRNTDGKVAQCRNAVMSEEDGSALRRDSFLHLKLPLFYKIIHWLGPSGREVIQREMWRCFKLSNKLRKPICL